MKFITICFLLCLDSLVKEVHAGSQFKSHGLGVYDRMLFVASISGTWVRITILSTSIREVVDVTLLLLYMKKKVNELRKK